MEGTVFPGQRHRPPPPKLLALSPTPSTRLLSTLPWGFQPEKTTGSHDPTVWPSPAWVTLSALEMTFEVSVVSIKAQLGERGCFLFQRCLYWVKYGLLLRSLPAFWSSLGPLVYLAHIAGTVCFSRYLHDVALTVHPLSHGTANSL